MALMTLNGGVEVSGERSVGESRESTLVIEESARANAKLDLSHATTSRVIRIRPGKHDV